jgi:hypothetical protein
MPSTCPSSASTTRRGIRQFTVRYAIKAARCGPQCPVASSGTSARVRRRHPVDAPVSLATLWADHAMALIFDDPRLNRRQLRHLMALHNAGGLHLLNLPGQDMLTVLALFWQDGPNLVDSLGRYQGPMRSRWPGWPPAFRRLFLRRPRERGSPASPSDEGGLEEFVEFCSRRASWRSKSAICFSASATCFPASAICFSRPAISRSPSRLGWLECRWPFPSALFPFARRDALAFIQAKLTYFSRLSSSKSNGELNCYAECLDRNNEKGSSTVHFATAHRSPATAFAPIPCSPPSHRIPLQGTFHQPNHGKIPLALLGRRRPAPAFMVPEGANLSKWCLDAMPMPE